MGVKNSCAVEYFPTNANLGPAYRPSYKSVRSTYRDGIIVGSIHDGINEARVATEMCRANSLERRLAFTIVEPLACYCKTRIAQNLIRSLPLPLSSSCLQHRPHAKRHGWRGDSVETRDRTGNIVAAVDLTVSLSCLGVAGGVLGPYMPKIGSGTIPVEVAAAATGCPANAEVETCNTTSIENERLARADGKQTKLCLGARDLEGAPRRTNSADTGTIAVSSTARERPIDSVLRRNKILQKAQSLDHLVSAGETPAGERVGGSSASDTVVGGESTTRIGYSGHRRGQTLEGDGGSGCATGFSGGDSWVCEFDPRDGKLRDIVSLSAGTPNAHALAAISTTSVSFACNPPPAGSFCPQSAPTKDLLDTSIETPCASREADEALDLATTCITTANVRLTGGAGTGTPPMNAHDRGGDVEMLVGDRSLSVVKSVIADLLSTAATATATTQTADVTPASNLTATDEAAEAAAATGPTAQIFSADRSERDRPGGSQRRQERDAGAVGDNAKFRKLPGVQEMPTAKEIVGTLGSAPETAATDMLLVRAKAVFDVEPANKTFPGTIMCARKNVQSTRAL